MIERLTKRNADGSVFLPKCFEKCAGTPDYTECEGCDEEYRVYERLAAYEDIGLMPEEAANLNQNLTAITEELEAAKRDIAALLWLNGNCEYCNHGEKEEFNGATRWTCALGSAADCRPEWRGKEKDHEQNDE